MDAMGCRRTGGHKSKAIRGHLGSRRSGFGSYGRGNFSGHDVLWVLSKILKNGCRWVIMDAHGCNGGYAHGGQPKQGKKSPKWASRTCFWMYVKVKKI